MRRSQVLLIYGHLLCHPQTLTNFILHKMLHEELKQDVGRTHIHHKTKIPLQEHLELYASQITHKPQHPSH